MDRIAELLAKGIDQLDAEELAELEALCRAEADDRFEADLTDEVNAELEQLAATLDAVRVENEKRAEAEEARRLAREALADRIRGVEPEAEPTEGDPEGTESEGGEEDEAHVEVIDVEEVIVEAEAPVPVAASSNTVTRVAARRPAAHTPQPRNIRQSALTASANVPGITAGKRLDSLEDIARAFTASADLVASARTATKLPVATMRADIPDARMLGRDPWLNSAKIDKVAGLSALTASGGMCAPVPYRYDLPVWGSNNRPVRDALARFGAQRGGIRTITPPTIDSTGIGDGISQWTDANDITPSNPATKPCMTILCDDTEVVTKVYAITNCLTVGNFRDRWFPEQIRAYVDLTDTWRARYAEGLMLASIATGSKVVTHGQVLGTAQDVFTSIRQLVVGIRDRHRIPRSQTFRVIGFEWVRDNLLTDLIRKGPGDGTLEERLVRAEGTLDGYFRALNCNVTWSPDHQSGVGVGSPGGPFAGAQGVGPIIGYPSVARFYIHLEGSWLALDGGELDLGVIRDSTLVGTNDMMIFSETFENVHYHGLPGESYVLDIDVCANGAWTDSITIDPCVSGS